ncbi:MAG: hypothetical protein HUK07_01805 [Bacteroidaceae bacterium]|nr:hypothetical protein [Bacteroidaceae bacterium]
MKRKFYLFLACLSASFFLTTSCSDDEPTVSESHEAHEHDVMPTYSTGAKVSYPAFFSDFDNMSAGGAKDVLKARFEKVVPIEQAKIAVVDKEYLLAHADEINALIARNGLVIMTKPSGVDGMTKSRCGSKLKVDGLSTFLQDIAKMEKANASPMFIGFTGSQDYLTMDNINMEKMSQSDIVCCFDAFVDWVNKTCKRMEPASRTSKKQVQGLETLADIEKTFNAMHFTHIYNLHLKKRIAQVLWSDEDWLERNSTASLNMEIYPIHVFDDQPGHGDYYICNSVMSIYNAGMYRGIFHNHHGGVTVHMCGFTMKSAQSLFEPSDSNVVVKFPITGIPTPETTSGSVSHTEGTTYSCNVNVTGGLMGLNGNKGRLGIFNPSITFGVTFNNSTTVVYPDVAIRKEGNDKIVEHIWEVNEGAMGDIKWNSDCLIEPQCLMSRSIADFRQSWIWYVPDFKDNSKEAFSFRHRFSTKYEAMKFYSTRVDFDRYTFNDAVVKEDSLLTFTISNVNRIPTGTIMVKNNYAASGINYVHKIVFYESGTTKEVLSREETLVNGEKLSAIVPEGKYDVVIYGGTTSNENTAYICRNRELKRCEALELSTANFTKK